MKPDGKPLRSVIRVGDTLQIITGYSDTTIIDVDSISFKVNRLTGKKPVFVTAFFPELKTGIKHFIYFEDSITMLDYRLRLQMFKSKPD